MKLSIVVAVLNSHEVVRRQVLHYERLGFPREDAEVIFMDDGSHPPLQALSGAVKVVPTNDTRPWTWAVARNSGAKIAQGEYLLMTDIDYVVTKKAIDDALAFDGDKMCFKREFGVLDESGLLTQDREVLISYGLSAARMASKGFGLPPHPNNFIMKKSVFWELGGFREDRVGLPYPQREDSYFKQAWKNAVAAGRFKDVPHRPTIYMFPNGQFCKGGDVDYNPFGLFHGLTRKTPNNPWFKKQRYA